MSSSNSTDNSPSTAATPPVTQGFRQNPLAADSPDAEPALPTLIKLSDTLHLIDDIHELLRPAHATLDLLAVLTSDSTADVAVLFESLHPSTLNNALHAALRRVEDAIAVSDKWCAEIRAKGGEAVQ